MIVCTVAELWTLTRTVLTKHCSEINGFFVVQLLMWAGPYIPVNYPWFEHVWKRWCLAVAANGWHDWAFRNLSRCFSVVSGCLAPCFVFLGGERLCVQTGNHGNTLYCIHITHRQDISTACIQTQYRVQKCTKRKHKDWSSWLSTKLKIDKIPVTNLKRWITWNNILRDKSGFPKLGHIWMWRSWDMRNCSISKPRN